MRQKRNNDNNEKKSHLSHRRLIQITIQHTFRLIEVQLLRSNLRHIIKVRLHGLLKRHDVLTQLLRRIIFRLITTHQTEPNDTQQ